jgi:hypothetical protein
LRKWPRQKGVALGEGGIRPLAGVEETNKNQQVIGEKPRRRTRPKLGLRWMGMKDKAGSTREPHGAAFRKEGGIIFSRFVAAVHTAVQRNSLVFFFACCRKNAGNTQVA